MSLEAATRLPPPAATAVDTKPKVLFVDDEPRVLTSMRMLFRGRCEAFFAEGGALGLEQLRRQPVDVIVSDQRMPGMTGIEFLRAARAVNPHAMRILLTGYSDLGAIIGSVNEGEIFRFVNKPWVNEVLLSTVVQAAEAARQSRPLAEPEPLLPAASAGPTLKTPSAAPEATAAAVPSLLVLDDDASVPQQMQQMLGSSYRVYGAQSLEAAVHWLETQRIGVVVSETRVQNQPVVQLIGSLKQSQPELVTVILTARADAGATIELINQGQIYRLLMKPLQETSCRIMVNSAQRHHQQLLKHPELVRRYAVETPTAPDLAAAPARRLMERVRALGSWVVGAR